MPEIYSLSKSSKVQTGFLPLEDLLNAFYEDNAREHSLELDLEDLAMRLLALGWCEHVTYNQKLNRIVDGHGRVLAAKWLSERSPDWFALQLKFAQQRGISATDEERYSPLYWTQVSIIATTLTDDDHAAMNLGLNAEKAFGVDDPDKLNKLLAGLDDEDRAIAGFSAKVKQAIATYGNISEATLQRAKGWAIAFGVMLLDLGLTDDPRYTIMGKRTLQRVAEDI